MKYVALLNGASEHLPARARQLYKFVNDHRANLEGKTTIMVHDGTAGREWLLANTFTRRVVLIEIDGRQPEAVLSVLPDYCRNVDLLLFPGDCFGEEMSVRLACRLNGGSLVGANSLRVDGEKILCGKKVYSQHLQALFEMVARPACVAMARGYGEEELPAAEKAEILEVNHRDIKSDFVVSAELRRDDNAAGLEQTRRLVVAGQGVGGREEVERLEEFAKTVGAALGVTRPAAMNAWASLSKLVGVSGAMTSPELCLTFGVSGAAAFYAGIEKSKFIVSVNRDKKAAMVRQSDVAVIDDCAAVLEELRKLVGERK